MWNIDGQEAVPGSVNLGDNAVNNLKETDLKW